MSFGGVFSVAALIVGVAMALVIVSSSNTAPIISALGSGFSGALSAATGGTTLRKAA
jgi:hypothetical protein